MGRKKEGKKGRKKKERKKIKREKTYMERKNHKDKAESRRLFHLATADDR